MSQWCSSAVQSALHSPGAAGTPANEETAHLMERQIPLKLLLGLMDAFLPGVERGMLASTDLY